MKTSENYKEIKNLNLWLFSIVKLNALINFDKWGVILKMKKSFITSLKKKEIYFICEVTSVGVLYHM